MLLGTNTYRFFDLPAITGIDLPLEVTASKERTDTIDSGVRIGST